VRAYPKLKRRGELALKSHYFPEALKTPLRALLAVAPNINVEGFQSRLVALIRQGEKSMLEKEMRRCAAREVLEKAKRRRRELVEFYSANSSAPHKGEVRSLIQMFDRFCLGQPPVENPHSEEEMVLNAEGFLKHTSFVTALIRSGGMRPAQPEKQAAA
jgi:hypothetical protein